MPLTEIQENKRGKINGVTQKVDEQIALVFRGRDPRKFEMLQNLMRQPTKTDPIGRPENELKNAFVRGHKAGSEGHNTERRVVSRGIMIVHQRGSCFNCPHYY